MSVEKRQNRKNQATNPMLLCTKTTKKTCFRSYSIELRRLETCYKGTINTT